jgi:hypothetical protein
MFVSRPEAGPCPDWVIRVAALFLIGLFAFGAKFDDSEYRACDRSHSAADPCQGVAVNGILDNVPQLLDGFPQPGRHFLKTAGAQDNPLAPNPRFVSRRALRKFVCAKFNRTKKFHVKRFGTFDP